MASFVAASAGVTICKHGNVAASSTSGSFDFLAAIGVDIDKTPAQVEQQLANHGLAFAWAKTFHPAMRHAGPVRTSLGISTVFNILGPLVHPGGVKRIVMGVATETRAEQLARVLFERGMIRAWVIAGFDGLDELSTAGPNRVFEVTRHDIREMTIHPEAAGIDLVATASLAGGTAADNARIFTAMIESSGGVDAAGDIVVLNAAAALVVAEIEPDLGTAVASARRALSSGQVKALYDEFIAED
jgi:anthranilate phosphoribosyltransferase